MNSYRGRIAPSPTGLLHLGHASTFVQAAERARQRQGTLIFRNDDLDSQRCHHHFYEAALEDLRWLGLSWTEGPDAGGPRGPYSQSQRHPLYHQAFEALRAAGCIYPCTCSRKEVALALGAPHAGDSPDCYPGTCRPHLPVCSALGRAGVNWRFRIPQPEWIQFEDGFFGTQKSLAGSDFGDFLVWRKDDKPSYQLATVVDDFEMKITEVVRGADLIPSTFQQLLLYRALQYPPPQFRHCPLVCDDSGMRLAKRSDALSLRTLRAQGMTPDEVLEQIRSYMG
ncbi:MAG: hypothetical protein RLZZ399_2314 [Verrucomicrobiota bacterium]|jgi:glutamyl-tRNA synthetase